MSWGQVDVVATPCVTSCGVCGPAITAASGARIELAARKHTFDWVYPTWNRLAAGILAILATGRALFEGIFGPLAFYTASAGCTVFIVTMLLLLLIASDARPTPQTPWLAQRLETAKHLANRAQTAAQKPSAQWPPPGWSHLAVPSRASLGLWVIWLCALVPPLHCLGGS